jgi:ATP-binding protein involved in chromosome partitioning
MVPKSDAPPAPRGAGAGEPSPEAQQGSQAPPRPVDPRIQQRQQMVARRLKDIDRVIVVMSGKGGVGKSSVAASLAVKLARQGQRVGLLDMDLTGPDLPRFLGVEDAKIKSGGDGMAPVEVEKNLVLMSIQFLLPDPYSAVVWRGPMKMGAIRQLIMDVDWGKLDRLIIDLPPGTSDEPLSVAQSIPDADGVVIVTTPHTVSILDVRKSIAFAKQVGLHVLGVVENMSSLDCPHCGKDVPIYGTGLGRKMAEELEIPFLGSVPMDPEAAGSGEEATPAMLRESPTGKAFDGVVQEVERTLEGRPRRKSPQAGEGPLPMA